MTIMLYKWGCDDENDYDASCRVQRDEVRARPGDNIVITSRLEPPHRSLSSALQCTVGWTVCRAGCAPFVQVVAGVGGGRLLGSLILSHSGHLLNTNEHSTEVKH